MGVFGLQAEGSVREPMATGSSRRRVLREGARRRPAQLLLAAVVLIVGAVPFMPQMAGAAVLPPEINDPPATGQIISFPARDFISATGWDENIYPTVDVEVLRPDPGNPANLIQVGIAADVAPQGGVVEVNHPGGACWDGVTPNITAGDIIRMTAKDVTGAVAMIDQTTTANVTITETVNAINADTVELRGTAVQADGSPIPDGQLEVRLVGSAADRFDLNGRRDLRAPGAGQFTTDGAGNWVANFTGLSAADMERALAAENRIVWLGRDPLAGTEATIFEVGDAVAPGPSAPCTAPLQGPAVTPSATALDFPATEVLASSAPAVVTLTNSGAGALADLSVSSVTVAGADSTDFLVDDAACTSAAVPVAGSCDVTVTFSPTAAGLRSAVLEIHSNGANPIVAVDVTGFGVAVGATVPQAVARPGFLGFAGRTQLTTSTPETTSIKNIGNADLHITSATIAGTHTSDFAISADSCTGATVVPGATCDISVTFTPQLAGDRVASLVVDSDAPQVLVELTGNGLATDGLVNINDFNGVALGVFTARDFVSVEGFDQDEVLGIQIIRSGVVVGQASAIAGADGIAEVNHPGGQCWDNVTPNIRAGDVLRVVRSNPTRIYETVTADVKVTQRATETAPGSNIVEMKGYARDLATGGPLPLGQIEARIIGASRDPFAINGRRSIRTAGEGTLAYDPISATNPDGTQWTATFDLNLSPDPAHDVQLAQTEENRILWLGRNPLALSELTFWEDGDAVADGPSAPCTAPGEAPSPGIVVAPASKAFPTLKVGEGVNRAFTIRNIGTAPLTVNSITFGGDNAGDFSVVGGVPGTIAPDGVASFTVRFSPTGLGARSATIRVNDNALGSPHTASLTGTGTDVSVPAAQVTPAAVAFPDTQVGVDSAAKVVTVLNEGSGTLVFNAVDGTPPGLAISGADADAFRIDPSATACVPSGDVAQDAVCTVTVVFTPTHVNASTASLVLGTNNPNPITVPLSGVSSITADGAFDPPRAPRSVEVFPVRDYVAGAGFPEGEFVQFEVYRNGNLIGVSEFAPPRDLDPTDLKFDGFVEVNHVGGVCWSGETPDIRPGDVVRALGVDGGTLAVTTRDQTHTADLSVTMPPTEVAPGVVKMTGTAVDPVTGGPMAPGAIEPRITSTNGLFDINGRRDLRGGLQGLVETNGFEWTVTFENLSAADVQRAVTGDPKVLWLGRDPLALTELTHWEWGEIPGPDPGCTTAPFLTPEPVQTASLNVGYSGLGVASAPSNVTLTNPAGSPGPVNVSTVSVLGLNPGDFAVTADACSGVTLAAGQSCTVGVQFTASALGLRLASLRIQHDGANGVSFTPLSGTGVDTPTISSATSPVGHGSIVHVTGTNLQSTTSVTLAGTAVLFTVLSDTAVDFTVPGSVEPTTSALVELTTAGGSATTTIEVLPDPPTITTVTPTSGKAGDSVVVTGANLSGASVTFNGVAAAVTANTSTTVTVTIPVGASTGPLRVATTGGAASVNFTVVPPPVITGFTPASAKTGTQITITGTGFAAGATVTFARAGGLTVAGTGVTVVSATSIRVTIPGTAVQGPVKVSSSGQTSVGTNYIVERAPTVSSLSPTTGAVGQAVTINGENFLNVSKVSLNGKTATFTILNARQISATVPGGATTGTFQITNKNGSVNSGTFTVIQPPTITGFTPTTATRGVTTVTVNGTNLGSVTQVTLTRTGVVVNATIVSTSATQLRFTVPAGSATGLFTIRATNPAGTGSSASAITII